MLRNCEGNMLAAEGIFCYDEGIRAEEDFMMKLPDKIIGLRKSNGMSQEELAEKLNVSRQAISRWEMGAAMPDAANILQLGKLFHVTTDYLLDDESPCCDSPEKDGETKHGNAHQVLVLGITSEVMVLILQFVTTIVLKNDLFGILSILPFVAIVGGFEYWYRKRVNAQNRKNADARKRFYRISAWLGTYFPLRILGMALTRFYLHPINTLVLEGVLVLAYLAVAMLITLAVQKCCLPKTDSE